MAPNILMPGASYHKGAKTMIFHDIWWKNGDTSDGKNRTHKVCGAEKDAASQNRQYNRLYRGKTD